MKLTGLLSSITALATTQDASSSHFHSTETLSQSDIEDWPCQAQLICDHPPRKQHERLDGEFVHILCECGAYLDSRDATPRDVSLPEFGSVTWNTDGQ